MRKLLLAVALAVASGTACAGAIDEMRFDPTAPDLSARLYYRLDFGSTGAPAQVVGLRFDDRFTAAVHTPDLLQARFAPGAAPVVTLQGFEVHGPAVAARQNSGGFNLFDWLTPGEWIALGGTVVAIGVVAANAGGGASSSTSGTGGS